MSYRKDRANGMTDEDVAILRELVRLPTHHDGLSAKVAKLIDDRIRAERALDASPDELRRTLADLAAKLDDALGTPCEQIRAEQARDDLPTLTRITRADRLKVAALLRREDGA